MVCEEAALPVIDGGGDERRPRADREGDGPAGNMTRSPKKHTSMPEAWPTKRSDKRQTIWLFLSAWSTAAAAPGPTGTTCMPRRSLKRANHSKRSGGSSGSTATVTGRPMPTRYIAPHSQPPRCGAAMIAPFPAAKADSTWSKPTVATPAATFH